MQHSGGFKEIKRKDYVRYLTLARNLCLFRKEKSYSDYMENWRDSPSGLEFYNKIYFSALEHDSAESNRDYELPELDFGLFQPREH